MIVSIVNSLTFIDEQTQVAYRLHFLLCLPFRSLEEEEEDDNEEKAPEVF